MLCSGESFREGWRPLPFMFLREALPPRPSWPEGSRRKAPSQKGRGKRGLGSRGASFTSARGGRAPRLRRREAGGQEPLGTPLLQHCHCVLFSCRHGAVHRHLLDPALRLPAGGGLASWPSPHRSALSWRPWACLTLPGLGVAGGWWGCGW